MAAFAHLTIPLTLATQAQLQDAIDILNSTPGTTDVEVAPSGRATLSFQFPGNIDAVMRRLVRRGLANGGAIGVSVPVVNRTGKVVDPTHLTSTLNMSPTVSGAAYDGSTVSATIVPLTASMRYMYEEIMIAGLTALDMPTVAGPQEFVL